MSNKQLKPNLLNADTWLRLLFMVLTLICLFIARFLIWFVALFQFLSVLIAGRDNDNMRNFGQGVSKWAYQGLLFLTFNSEEKPYPFSEWPTVEETEPYVVASEEEPENTETSQAQPEERTPEQDATPVAQPPAESVDEGGEAEVQLDDDVPPADNDVPSFTHDDAPAEDDADQPLKDKDKDADKGQL